jgi:hypothetical protein
MIRYISGSALKHADRRDYPRIMRYRFDAIPPRMNHLNSPGQILAHGNNLTAYCENPECRHSAAVNLVAVAKAVGVETMTYAKDYRRILFCAPCRAAGRPDRNTSVRIGNARPYSTIADREDQS